MCMATKVNLPGYSLERLVQCSENRSFKSLEEYVNTNSPTYVNPNANSSTGSNAIAVPGVCGTSAKFQCESGQLATPTYGTDAPRGTSTWYCK